MTTAYTLATIIGANGYVTSATQASSATSVMYGTNGAIVYQSGPTQSTTLPLGPANAILQSNGFAPYWSTVTNTLTNNIVGGLANQILYQVTTATTGFVTAPTTASTFLFWSGASFAWTTNVVANATNLNGGSSGQIPYQTNPGVTSFTPVPASAAFLQWGGSSYVWAYPVTAVNGTNNQIVVSQSTGNVTVSLAPNIEITDSLSVGLVGPGVKGSIRATGTIIAYQLSDISLKENIQDIPNALETVKQIGGKFWDWSENYIENMGGEDGYYVNKKDFGVVAQDVLRVFPRAVKKQVTGQLSVDYQKLCALAFQAIKELNDKIEKLEDKK
jgi:hypothetical protein